MAIPRLDKLRYLGSIIQEEGDTDDDTNQWIKVRRQKRKNALGVLCDKRISLRLKGRIYHMVIIPALLHGLECWPI